MGKMSFSECVAALSRDEFVPEKTWRLLLSSLDGEQRRELMSMARAVAMENFGDGVYVRALIEISSYCRNGCYYCGLRSPNKEARRYRLTKEQVMDCCDRGAALGFNTFVLQGGEDVVQSDEWLADVVRCIKGKYPEKAVTLSVGERSRRGYEMLRDAGADRYLLRHESACESLYSRLHPDGMSLDNRMECLRLLKELGYQTGSGMMIGAPGQGIDELVADLLYLDRLKPAMIGIGPFIPAAGTPFENEAPGTADMALLVISLLRMRFPGALIPSTTALATLCENGTELGILAGANVVMPNLTPAGYAEKYTIYNNKKIHDSESAGQLELLERKLNRIGYRIDFGRGDYKEM